MLEGYYKSGPLTTDERTQRLLAVQAALEIAKAGAGSSGTMHALDSIKNDLSKAADAIQEALKK